MTQSDWRVELVRASGNVYPIPGPGLDGLSTYRVYRQPSGTSALNIFITRTSGTGEEYSGIIVTRVPGVLSVP